VVVPAAVASAVVVVVAGDASAVVGADCSATAGVADLLDSDMLKSFQLRVRGE
jgi:hypothetical protein